MIFFYNESKFKIKKKCCCFFFFFWGGGGGRGARVSDFFTKGGGRLGGSGMERARISGFLLL